MKEMNNVMLDLSTMEGLNEEVRRLFQALSSSMGPEDKASINISIELKRIKDTESLINVTYKVKPTYPGKARQIVANADLIGNLSVMANPIQTNLFNKKEEKTNVS